MDSWRKIGDVVTFPPGDDPDLSLPRERAQVCVECERVFDVRRTACPGCGSTGSITLARLLDGRRNRALLDALKLAARALLAASR